jgi:predicted transcriptional regulator of viral defense system
MVFEKLLNFVGDEPVFETGLLLAGNVDSFDVHRQLTRWKAAGKIYQLRRGLYCLAPPYQKVVPHPYLIANRLQPGSYVSLQSALAYHGMIPELVPVTTSVTTCRPQSFNIPLGQFHFRHIQVDWFRGYELTDLGSSQKAFVATAEKALLDLVYLQPKGETIEYLRSLRLQATDQLNLDQLHRLVSVSNKPKLLRALKVIQVLAEEETGYEAL